MGRKDRMGVRDGRLVFGDPEVGMVCHLRNRFCENLCPQWDFIETTLGKERTAVLVLRCTGRRILLQGDRKGGVWRQVV